VTQGPLRPEAARPRRLPRRRHRIPGDCVAAENPTSGTVRDYWADAGGCWSLDRSCRTDLGEQPLSKPTARLGTSVYSAVRADRGFLGQAAGIGQGQLRGAHTQANEGDLDLPPDQEPAGPSAAARAHEAGGYGFVTSASRSMARWKWRSRRSVGGGPAPVGVNGRWPATGSLSRAQS